MRLLPDGSFRYSPQDLIAWLEGDFAAWCDRNHAERARGLGRDALSGHDFARDASDEESELVKRRGIEHEAAHLAALRARDLTIAEITHDETAARSTEAAMAAGPAVIYQGELRADPWMGIADFLHRVAGASRLGPYHYEPWDTKLALSAKPYFVLQLCAYAEMLETMQGLRPEHFGFIFGDGSESVFRTADYWNYYRRLKRSFERFQQTWSVDVVPDPALDRTHGRWSENAARHLEFVDDLSLVAGIARNQIVRLREAGVRTVGALATVGERIIPKMNAATVRALSQQAAMQVASRESGQIRWAFRAPDPERPRRGLALLPLPSVNDVFFDLEGFPFAPGGLEYLFGVVTVEQGAPEFRDWWAHDEAEEKRAFEQFMDWVYARWKADPSLHIYHYAGYERTALQRLMGKYATREFEVDQLLRHHVLVDLYPVVLQGMVIGTPSYSLKDIERLYMPARTEAIISAGGSVVEYQRWIDSGQSRQHAESAILAAIRDYNRVDCESTVGLRDWLLERQREAGITYPIDEGKDTAASMQREASDAEQLASQLLTRAVFAEAGSEEQRVTELLAWLLEFHRREDKPYWWKFFERMVASDEELYEDMDCLAGLERTDTPVQRVQRSDGWEYRFDPDQETKLHDGSKCMVAGSDNLKCTIARLDCDAGLALLKIGTGKTLPDRLSLLSYDSIDNDPLRKAILGFVLRWNARPDASPALADLLYRRPPRLIGLPLCAEENADLCAQATDAVRRLDRSTLCIQGPPGTGKTTVAAEIILALLDDGKRVGIVANSHQVTLNLLDRICCKAQEAGRRPTLIKVGEGEHRFIASGEIEQIESKAAAARIAAGPLAIAGTAWLFARPELISTLDYLFIEEAGQFSLANTVAVGSCASNLVLLGDQLQLSQPLQGSHPGESGLSALEYLLQGHATVPPELGIFLGLSYRMHPDVCRIISEAYYEGRLRSASLATRNRVVGGAATSLGIEAGVRFVPVPHEGSTQQSDEEVARIEQLVAELLRCRVEVKKAPARPLTLDDILIVAPFNMQVRALKSRLGARARIGTVDKFQGQEAAVVIVSMCASTLDDAPRGPEFLLSPNRLNVAISRAQALAIVVGSPALGDVRVRSVDEMRLVSGWCRVEECVAVVVP